jgi:hypothetical protein
VRAQGGPTQLAGEARAALSVAELAHLVMSYSADAHTCGSSTRRSESSVRQGASGSGRLVVAVRARGLPRGTPSPFAGRVRCDGRTPSTTTLASPARVLPRLLPV